MKNINHAGFTLIELLVVLLILVVLTTVAVQSVDGIQDQSRYDATQRGMQNIEDAVLGQANQREADGSELITGFVADMGRPPVALMLNGNLQMQELWDNPSTVANPTGLLSFALRQATTANVGAGNEDLEVFVPCGWRGPYLRLGVGQTDLLDGWGRHYDLFKFNRGAVVVGEQVSLFRSRGSDHPDLNSAPSNDYREELYMTFQTDAFASPIYPVATAVDRHHASSVVVTVVNANGSALSGTLSVKYYGPDPATGGVKLISLPVTGLPATSAIVTFNDPAITIGPRILRVYEGAAPPYPRKSPVTRVVLKPGGNQVTLRLP